MPWPTRVGHGTTQRHQSAAQPHGIPSKRP